jgi:hypothetical protein
MVHDHPGRQHGDRLPRKGTLVVGIHAHPTGAAHENGPWRRLNADPAVVADHLVQALLLGLHAAGGGGGGDFNGDGVGAELDAARLTAGTVGATPTLLRQVALHTAVPETIKGYTCVNTNTFVVVLMKKTGKRKISWLCEPV